MRRVVAKARKSINIWLLDKGLRFGKCPSNKELIQALLDHADCPEPVRAVALRGKKAVMHAFVQWATGQPTTKRVKTKNVKSSADFYASDEWRALRYRVLKHYGRRCMVCGATPEDGKKMHVDHIKPRSRFPHLELEFTNLQVLCEDCNLGKSNTDSIDWRPSALRVIEGSKIARELDVQHLSELRERGL